MPTKLLISAGCEPGREECGETCWFGRADHCHAFKRAGAMGFPARRVSNGTAWLRCRACREAEAAGKLMAGERAREVIARMEETASPAEESADPCGAAASLVLRSWAREFRVALAADGIDLEATPDE
jgi:hypothetical protein